MLVMLLFPRFLELFLGFYLLLSAFYTSESLLFLCFALGFFYPESGEFLSKFFFPLHAFVFRPGSLGLVLGFLPYFLKFG